VFSVDSDSDVEIVDIIPAQQDNRPAVLLAMGDVPSPIQVRCVLILTSTGVVCIKQ
jgi:hypothetical protein